MSVFFLLEGIQLVIGWGGGCARRDIHKSMWFSIGKQYYQFVYS